MNVIYKLNAWFFSSVGAEATNKFQNYTQTSKG